ncbi:MAG: YggS family pyridoxal phosphate enzyme, partial [Pseudomonadota bacterium]
MQRRIDDAAARFGRDPASITLIAVAKRHPADAIRTLAAAGHQHFAENYYQEAEGKLAALADVPTIRWHFIGKVQRNKTSGVAQHFDWAHCIDRAVIADRLSSQRPAGRP